MLVNRREDHVGLVLENRLGAVAVMHVEIEHRDALHTGRERLERGDGDGIEVAETHRVVLCGVMSRRAEQTERGLAFARQLHRMERAAHRAPRVLVDLRMRGRVAVEGLRRGLYMGDVLLGVRADDLFVGDLQRRGPLQREFLLRAQFFQRAADPRRPFGMAGRGIAGAAFVSDDRHGVSLPGTA